MNKYKKTGWFNYGSKHESYRHALSAKGISTGRKADYATRREKRDALIGGGIGLLAGGVGGAVVGAGAGYIVGGRKNKKPDYAKSWGQKDFRIDDHITINCHGEDTRSGFRHICDIYKDGVLIDSAKATYQNMTWESYEFETVIKKAIDGAGFSEEEKKRILDKTAGRSHAGTESMFKTTAMVASLGDIFGTTKKEKNDWKVRMVKAGLGGKGLEMPEDWDTLTEEEKEKRLNNMIAFMKKTDYAKTVTTKKEIKSELLPFSLSPEDRKQFDEGYERYFKDKEKRRTGKKTDYAKTTSTNPKVEMDTFGVDSGQVIITDPAYIDKIGKHFNYDKMIKFMYAGKGNKNGKIADERRALYLRNVVKKAYPKSGQNVDKLVTIQNTGGDGEFVVNKKKGKLIINTY